MIRNRLRGLLALCLGTALFFGTAAFAGTNNKCNRAIRFANLSEQARASLSKGNVIAWVDTNTDSVFHMGYTLRLVNTDAELLMAMFSAYGEQKDYLKNKDNKPLLAKSDILFPVSKKPGKFTTVEFELITPVYLKNSHYVVDELLSKEKTDTSESFLLSWKFNRAYGDNPPKYIDGYFRTEKVGNTTLMIYCNYVIVDAPDVFGSIDKINKDGFETMPIIVDSLYKHTEGLSSDQRNQYLTSYRALW